jgi:hypothetical protein
MPRWYKRLWGWINPPLQALIRIAIIIAALSFLQRVDPTIDGRINHEAKTLTIATSFLPVTVQIYAFRFEINNLVDAVGHVSVNSEEPIDAIGTRGFILGKQTIWPWRGSITIDLKQANGLTFKKLSPQPLHQEGLYCLAIEALNPLSNQSVIQLILTSETMFPLSTFGPMPPNAGMGGGYKAWQNVEQVEQRVKSDCRAMYDRVRGR